MITPLDVTGKLYKLLNVADVKNLITGNVYNAQPRPNYTKGKSKSDVTIWPLAQTWDDIQAGIFNVNVIVPDNADGTVGTVLINQITKIVSALLHKVYIYELDAEVKIQRATLMTDAELSEHYMNIRVYVENPNI